MESKIKLTSLCRAPSKKELNSEWIELVNESETPFNGEGCSITVIAKQSKGRPRQVTTIKAGFVMKPNERVRLITGSPGKSSQGEAPTEEGGVRNHHLFLKAPYLDLPGALVRLVNRQQVELCRAVLAAD